MFKANHLNSSKVFIPTIYKFFSLLIKKSTTTVGLLYSCNTLSFSSSPATPVSSISTSRSFLFRKPTVVVFIWLISLPSIAQTFSLSSPNKKIVTKIVCSRAGINYSISLNKAFIITESKLRLSFSNINFLNDCVVGKAVFKDSTDEYDLIIGKASHIRAQYRELRIPLSKNNQHIQLIFRSFDDGIAFRYAFVSGTSPSFDLTDESAEFSFSGDPITKALLLPNYTSSHEGDYTTQPLSKFGDDHLMDMPALFQLNNAYLAITEAALLNYAGTYLVKKDGKLQTVLSPLPNTTSNKIISTSPTMLPALSISLPEKSISSDKQSDASLQPSSSIKVKGTYPHLSPWRVILLSDKVNDLITTNILTTLSPPSRIKDISWIKPGTTTFPWWNGNVLPDTINAPGNNFVTQQYYIDFCARNNITYHSVVEYGLHQWYMDDGVGFQPGPHADVTTPVPGLNMKEVCDYAHSKGVGIRVWVHWAALYPKLDSAFAIFERWGLSGMMIDFMDRDDQEMVNMQTEMLEKAAQHHLHVQFHGAYKPTGLSRTYPNEFTREGTRNYETNKWGPAVTANHDLDIAFTRMLAGSTDYHLGGFRAVTPSQYKVQYTRPLMLSTRAHMLAMYVILENAVGMVCDYPAAYEGQDGFEFIKEVPTTWDETVVPVAKINEVLVIARRKGDNWYIGAINNDAAKTIEVDLSFLKGSYNATLFMDGLEVMKDPNLIKKESKQVNASAKIKLSLAASGGAVVKLIKQETDKN